MDKLHWWLKSTQQVGDDNVGRRIFLIATAGARQW
jgi:hypothetical protein